MPIIFSKDRDILGTLTMFGSCLVIFKLSHGVIGSTTVFGTVSLGSSPRGGANSINYVQPVLQYDLEGKFIRESVSVTKALYIIGKTGDGIGACCRGNQKTAYGYKWKYK